MLKKQIMLDEDRDDGYQYEYCDRCGREAGGTTHMDGQDVCDDCKIELNNEKEKQYERLQDLYEAEKDPIKANEILKKIILSQWNY